MLDIFGQLALAHQYDSLVTLLLLLLPRAVSHVLFCTKSEQMTNDLLACIISQVNMLFYSQLAAYCMCPFCYAT